MVLSRSFVIFSLYVFKWMNLFVFCILLLVLTAMFWRVSLNLREPDKCWGFEAARCFLGVCPPELQSTLSCSLAIHSLQSAKHNKEGTKERSKGHDYAQKCPGRGHFYIWLTAGFLGERERGTRSRIPISLIKKMRQHLGNML